VFAAACSRTMPAPADWCAASTAAPPGPT
jgi:hypothetical protein